MNYLVVEMAGGAQRLRKIYDRIPGFRDYSLADERVVADKLLRSYISNELLVQRDRLSELEVELMGRSDRRHTEVDRAVMELQLVIDQAKLLDPGDARWVSQERLREEDLELLYRTDALLLGSIDRIAEKATEMVGRQRTNDSFAPLVGEMLIALREMIEKLERRTEVIRSPLA